MPRFYNYSTVVLQGTSGAGKTSLMQKIIEQRQHMFFIPPTKIIYVYNHFQDSYHDMITSGANITFLKSIPSENQLQELCGEHEHSLLICDDKLLELGQTSSIAEAFTRLAHHMKMTVFILVQISNLSKMKYGGEIIKNTHYHILFKSAQMGYIIRALGLRINDYKNLSTAYKLATDTENFTYLSVNLHPRAHSIERYSTSILASDTVTKLFTFDSK